MPRVMSAIAMIVIAALALWLGGWCFVWLICFVIGASMWEFTRLLQPQPALLCLALGGIAGLSLVGFSLVGFFLINGVLMFPLLMAAPLIGVAFVKQHRLLFWAYSTLIMMAGGGFIFIGSSVTLIWFVMIIIISDVAGYFAGRFIGGPKFWPRVSPKKTWSGTVAGWIGAFILGLVGMYLGRYSLVEASLFPLVAFAGQMGDIAQSAIKRKMGVKDSSNLIPGHGGVLDRFDAMIGAGSGFLILALLGIFYGI